MHFAEKRIEIRAPVARVFDLFSDFESFPRWMENIRKVRRTGRRFTRWAAEAPFGTEVEWEAELTRFEPDRRIAWRSVRGDIDTEGEVFFEETRRGTTLMHVMLGYALPAGRLGEMVARLFGRDPEQQLADDLERFAAVVESRSRRDAGRDRRESAERDVDRRRRREHDYSAASRLGRPTHNEEEELFARERRARFENDRETARRSRLESPRRSSAQERAWRERRRADSHPERSELERERTMPPERARYADDGRRPLAFDEGERRRALRDERLERDERREALGRREADERYADEDRLPPRTHRHALTPREREMEREERAPDYDYREQAFRRGVDKLMNEPPSRRWRRWD